jgi:hypothetical protein
MGSDLRPHCLLVLHAARSLAQLHRHAVHTEHGCFVWKGGSPVVAQPTVTPPLSPPPTATLAPTRVAAQFATKDTATMHGHPLFLGCGARRLHKQHQWWTHRVANACAGGNPKCRSRNAHNPAQVPPVRSGAAHTCVEAEGRAREREGAPCAFGCNPTKGRAPEECDAIGWWAVKATAQQDAGHSPLLFGILGLGLGALS